LCLTKNIGFQLFDKALLWRFFVPFSDKNFDMIDCSRNERANFFSGDPNVSGNPQLLEREMRAGQLSNCKQYSRTCFVISDCASVVVRVHVADQSNSDEVNQVNQFKKFRSCVP